MMKVMNKLLFSLAGIGLIAGCTANGNIVGADTGAGLADLPVHGSPVPPSSSDPFAAPSPHPVNGFPDLVVELVYKDPVGYNEAGQTLYYIGQTFEFEIKLSNYSVNDLSCLNVYSGHQYYTTGTCGNSWWAPGFPGYDGSPVDTKIKGSNLSGNSSSGWTSFAVPSNNMVVLTGTYTIPYTVCPGLSQTAIMVEYCGPGFEQPILLYYNPEQGVFDPPMQP